MTCQSPSNAFDICPSQEEIVSQLLLELPRGRAWSTHDGLPQPGTTIWAFFNALANVWAWVNQRICALKLEFFCATANETMDLWMAEYGLPDGCDPFPDLCAKVAAIGGNQCEYYQTVAARAGWSISCGRDGSDCGALAGAALAGLAVTGGSPAAATLLITVSLSLSSAYGGLYRTPPFAGLMQAGMPLACAPDISPLQCLLARITRAHCALIYQTTP
ncbi:MAG TPA: hypothetical protein VGH40_11780 [Roseiarcus sp.]|jgi:uncharacterized protein YmfQ (DUF2313 family)